MRELRGELEEMSNKVEVLNDRVQKSEKRQSDLYNDTDARLRRIEQLAKDDGEARKKLVTQAGEIDARLKKLESAPGRRMLPQVDRDGCPLEETRNRDGRLGQPDAVGRDRSAAQEAGDRDGRGRRRFPRR